MPIQELGIVPIGNANSAEFGAVVVIGPQMDSLRCPYVSSWRQTVRDANVVSSVGVDPEVRCGASRIKSPVQAKHCLSRTKIFFFLFNFFTNACLRPCAACTGRSHWHGDRPKCGYQSLQPCSPCERPCLRDGCRPAHCEASCRACGSVILFLLCGAPSSSRTHRNFLSQRRLPRRPFPKARSTPIQCTRRSGKPVRAHAQFAGWHSNPNWSPQLRSPTQSLRI